MKKNLLTALTSLALASSSMGAVTVSLSTNPNSGPQFFSPTSVVLDGSLIRIGTFNAAPASNSTFAQLETAFHEFARTTMGNPNNVNTGRVTRSDIAGADTATSPDADTFFIGKNIYVWVYNAAAADPQGNQGVFSTASTFADQPTAVITSMTTYLNAFGTWVPNGGTAAAVVVSGTGAATRFNLAANIPEPGVTLLGGLVAMLGLVRRRR